MTNPAHAAALAYCLEHDLPTTAGDAGEEGPESNPSTEVYLFMAGWEACDKTYVGFRVQFFEMAQILKDEMAAHDKECAMHSETNRLLVEEIKRLRGNK